MAQEKFKMPKQVNFILFGEALDLVNRGGTKAISLGYNDNFNALKKGAGQYVEYIIGTDKYGKPKGKRFKFDESFRKVQTRDGEQDLNGVSQFEFLRNHPDCEGSPNGDYVIRNGEKIQQGAVYRIYDPQRDAEVAFDSMAARVKAQNDAFNLDPETLGEVANILGYYGEPDKAMRTTVVEYASKRPSEFYELLESGDRSLRALVRKALNEEVFTKKGSLIMWGTFMVGGNEDDAINTLMKDQNMIDKLKEKLGIDFNAKAEKNVGGRPKKKVEEKTSEPVNTL